MIEFLEEHKQISRWLEDYNYQDGVGDDYEEVRTVESKLDYLRHHTDHIVELFEASRQPDVASKAAELVQQLRYVKLVAQLTIEQIQWDMQRIAPTLGWLKTTDLYSRSEIRTALALAAQADPDTPEPIRAAATHALVAWRLLSEISPPALMWAVASQMAELLTIYAD